MFESTLSVVGLLAVLVISIYFLFSGDTASKKDLKDNGNIATTESNPISKVDTNKEYALEEIAKHNSLKDVWIIIHGLVYDVTKYHDEHPGGDVILKNPGGDVTQDFESSIHPGFVTTDLLPDLLIGKVKK